ncbi:hypothetical protein LV779_01660 [Streptomyces thinghirensis]|nr:hypothetical protein [Streptomyces thinghirensis]
MALGAFPDATRCTGNAGMHVGHRRHRAAEGRPDRRPRSPLDDRVTGKLDSFAPYAKIVHADIDPAEIGKNRAATCDRRRRPGGHRRPRAGRPEGDSEGNTGDYSPGGRT